LARKRSPWFVPHDRTKCDFDFFISHVQDDQQEIVDLKRNIEEISGRSGTPLRCFLDVHNWEIGNVNGGVIRQYLLNSAHMIIWATPKYVRNVRGWIWLELAHAQLIELSSNVGKFDLSHPFIVPVFRSLKLNQIHRTPLLEYWQRGLAPGNLSIPAIAQKLVDFHQQEIKKSP
jgi:hypothetical protein